VHGGVAVAVGGIAVGGIAVAVGAPGAVVGAGAAVGAGGGVTPGQVLRICCVLLRWTAVSPETVSVGAGKTVARFWATQAASAVANAWKFACVSKTAIVTSTLRSAPMAM
jgi:hypothetical protein